MLKNGYDYALALYREDGAPLGQASVDVDWEPARQWVRFLAIRQGRIVRHGGDAVVEPIWRATGEPCLQGVRVSVETAGQPGGVSCDLPTTYFKGLAQAACTPFVEAGQLVPGESFRFMALAYPQVRAEGTGGGLSLVIEDVTPPPVLHDASIAQLRGQAGTMGTVAKEDVPAFVPQRVLDEIASLTGQAGPLETGGALVGYLHRDPTVPEVFARITGQIPAQHTRATATRLTFTSETWEQLRTALDQRQHGEVMLGWWHSHPVREWCRQDGCAEDGHADCALSKDCFSEHDCAVHRTVFPGAYSIALVANDVSVRTVTFSVFGWRAGALVPRGVYVVEE